MALRKPGRLPRSAEVLSLACAVLLPAAVAFFTARLLAAPAPTRPKPVIKPFGSTNVEDRAPVARLDGLMIEAAQTSKGERCLTIGVRASSCFGAHGIASGQAVLTYTRCPSPRRGWRIVAGLAPPETSSASILSRVGADSAERVRNEAFAFRLSLPDGGAKAPETLDLRGRRQPTLAIHFPIGPDEHDYCGA